MNSHQLSFLGYLLPIIAFLGFRT